jgi:tRNA(Ile)-lysidine synthase TilS/MesJ
MKMFEMTQRAYTRSLLSDVSEGMFDKDNLIRDLLNWMSEKDVEEFCQANDIYSESEDEDEEDEDEGRDWGMEWYDTSMELQA